MSVVKSAATGVACAVAALGVSEASASLTADWAQTLSPTSGHILNTLNVESSTDWIAGALFIELDASPAAGQLLYTTPGVSPASTSDTYINNLATRTFGGNPLDPINSQIPGGSDTASLLDPDFVPDDDPLTPPPPAVTNTKTFDLTWFGPPDQTDDITGIELLDLAKVTASNTATGNLTLRLANQTEADDLLLSGIVFRGMLLDSVPLPADANLDGTVNGQDLAILAANFGSGNGVWLQGEFSGDGVINGQDLAILAANFGSSASFQEAIAQYEFAAVPEPGSLATLGLLSLAGLSRRRYSS